MNLSPSSALVCNTSYKMKKGEATLASPSPMLSSASNFEPAKLVSFQKELDVIAWLKLHWFFALQKHTCRKRAF